MMASKKGLKKNNILPPPEDSVGQFDLKLMYISLRGLLLQPYLSRMYCALR